MQLQHPAPDALHLRGPDQRERDGSAHAAAQRRPAAVPALRRSARRPRRACGCTRITTATSSITSTFPDGYSRLTRRSPRRSSSPDRLPPLPETLGSRRHGHRLDAATCVGRLLGDASHPSPFTRPTPRLEALASELRPGARRRSARDAPRTDATSSSRASTYSPQSTRVDSPIDDALETRRGVCQDFAHIMIALVRQLGIPCRYVSGYLFHEADDSVHRLRAPRTRGSKRGCPDSTGSGSIRPTTWQRTSATSASPSGRDYADVPPTRGVFKGLTAVRSELSVAVSVGTAASGALESGHGDDSVGFPRRHESPPPSPSPRSNSDDVASGSQTHGCGST